MDEKEFESLAKKLQEQYALVKKQSLYWLLGGAAAFLSAAGFLSYKAVLEKIENSAVGETGKRIAKIADKAEADAKRIASAVVMSEDTGWALLHAAAAGACAATSPVGGSSRYRIAIPKRGARTCADSCKFETDGYHTECSTSVAVGGILTKRAEEYGTVVAKVYNYGCEDRQNGYDEVKGSAEPYTAYCCCFHVDEK